MVKKPIYGKILYYAPRETGAPWLAVRYHAQDIDTCGMEETPIEAAAALKRHEEPINAKIGLAFYEQRAKDLKK